MSRRAEPIDVGADDATTILRSLTSGGVEPAPDVSCVDACDAATPEGRPIMWF